jgi:hypothetical protein
MTIDAVRVADLTYVYDALIAPLLGIRKTSEHGHEDVIDLGLVESFLWVRFGTAFGIFRADEANRMCEHSLGAILRAHPRSVRAGILSQDVAKVLEEYLETNHFREERRADSHERALYLAALNATVDYLCRFPVRTLINALCFCAEDVWTNILKQSLDVKLLGVAASEYERTECNELTNCAAGALLTLEHLMAFESLEGYEQPALLRILQEARNWSLGFDRTPIKTRFIDLIEVLENHANDEASRSSQKRISSEALTTIALERIQIWQAGLSSAYPTRIPLQEPDARTVSSGRSHTKTPASSPKGNGSHVCRAFIDSLYSYEACAFGVSAELVRPVQRSIAVQAATVLASSGGRGFQLVENFRADGIVSFRSATVEVAGSYDDCHQVCTTYASAALEGIDIAGMVTADRIVSRLSVYAPPSNGQEREASFDITGSHFENLRIAGRKIDVKLDTYLLHHHDTYSKLTRAYQHGKADSLLLGNGFSHLSGEQLSDLEEMYHSLSGISRLVNEWKKPKRPTDRGIYTLSAANHIDLSSQVGPSEMKGYGSIICIPKFGVIRLAEMTVEKSRRKLKMLQLDLEGPQEGSIVVGGTQVGGTSLA